MGLNRTQAPGKAIVIEQSPPITRCHLSTPMRFWLVGIPSRISFKWFYWCGGKEKFMLTMSITHTRKTWHVYHVQLSDLSFFREKTSLLLAE